MLPEETSLTYASDLAKHYREIETRFFPPPARQPRPPPIIEAEPVKPEPGPPREPDFVEVELEKLEPDHREQILLRHPCRRIIDEVCLRFDVLADELLSHTRKHPITRIRQFAMWRCRTECGLSLPVIGRQFGRDHATVLHAVRKIERERLAAAAGE